MPGLRGSRLPGYFAHSRGAKSVRAGLKMDPNVVPCGLLPAAIINRAGPLQAFRSLWERDKPLQPLDTVRETDFILTELWRRSKSNREEEGDNGSEVRSNRESGGGVAEGKPGQHATAHACYAPPHPPRTRAATHVLQSDFFGAPVFQMLRCEKKNPPLVRLWKMGGVGCVVALVANAGEGCEARCPAARCNEKREVAPNLPVGVCGDRRSVCVTLLLLAFRWSALRAAKTALLVSFMD